MLQALKGANCMVLYDCMRWPVVQAQAIEEINSQTGANMDPNADPNELMQQTTRGLMAAVSRLPQLTDRKRTLDKHTNLLHHLLRVGRNRSLASTLNHRALLCMITADTSRQVAVLDILLPVPRLHVPRLWALACWA